MSKHERIKEQIFEQEDQFYLEDGDINVRLAIPAGSYYYQYVKVEKGTLQKLTKIDTYAILNKKIGEDVMYKIVICDDDKNFIFYMKEMLFAMRLE